jgi:protein O-GlcNAc transferase
VKLRPEYAVAYNNLGNTLKAGNQLEEAEACYRTALAIKPGFAEAHSNLGNTLKGLGRLEDAVLCFRKALELRPDYAEAYSNLGNTLQEQRRMAEAEACYRTAIALKPDTAEAYNNLGITLKEQGRLSEAEPFYRTAIRIKPDFPQAYSNLGNALMEQGRLHEAEECYRTALSITPEAANARSNLLYSHNFVAAHSPAFLLEEARVYGQVVTAKATAPFGYWHCSAEPDRLRVGLVSGDFNQHPVGYFLEGVLSHLNRTRLELFAYPTHHRQDPLTGRIRPSFTAWKPLVGKNDQAAAALIHSDGIHILIDLAGHTAYNRLPLFAWKPAPVQVSWLGYFATTGMAEMDFLLADSIGVPAEHQQHFTERLWYVPDTRLCFTPPINAPLPSSLPALQRNGIVTLGSFQALAKIGNHVLRLWSRVLQALPKPGCGCSAASLMMPQPDRLSGNV